MNVDGTTDMGLDSKTRKSNSNRISGRTFRRKRSRRRNRSGSRRKRWKLYSKRCTERYDLPDPWRVGEWMGGIWV